MSIECLFETFLNNLAVKNRSDISRRYKEITKVLNREFRNSDSETDNCLQIGSFGRNTAIDGISDLDMLYILPNNVESNYKDEEGPREILTKVKEIILARYPRTDVKVNRCIVSVSYTNFHIEVQPVFEQSDGSFSYPDTYTQNWKITKPREEICELNKIDKLQNGIIKALCKMTRAWKNKSGTAIGGLLIDTLVYNFFNEHNDYANSNYPTVCRDFFYYLSKEEDKQYYLALGSNQRVKVQKPFQKKAKRAYDMSVNALNESDIRKQAQIWRDIFGNYFPKTQDIFSENNYSQLDSTYRNTEEFIEEKYPINIKYNLEIDCKVTQAGFRPDTLSNMLLKKIPLKACKKLRFYIVKNDVTTPYEVRWKVLNRGEEARKRDKIRGQIETDIGHEEKIETTDFKGNHIVECYIIKDSIVVARDFIDVPITTNRI